MLADLKSQSSHRISFLTCLASLVLLTACSDPEPSPGPGTGQSEDKASDGDDGDSADADDSEDDDVIDTGKIDGGKTDAGKADAGKLDAGKDAGKADAGSSGDGSAPTQLDDLDAGHVGHDATVADATAPTTKDASADAGAPVVDAGTPVVDAGSVLPPDPGKVAAADVVTIGDSWMSNMLQIEGTGGGISPSLRRASGQRYVNKALQGVMLLKTSGFGPAIPTQWDDATRENKNIKTVVMTAGGNDIIQEDGLQDDCVTGGDLCKAKLTEIAASLKTLWGRMAAAGVKDIIHIAYAKSAGAGFKDAEENAKNLAALCAAVPAPTRCRIVGTDDLVGGRSGIAFDGIHPTQAANDRIAAAIYKLMEAEHIAR